MPEEQAAELRALAAQRRQSMAEVIREGIALVLRSRGGATLDERRRRATAAAGAFHFGSSDVAERHDEYFADAVTRENTPR